MTPSNEPQIIKEIKISKNIPIPLKKRNNYPWGKMDVGDSFWVHKPKGQSFKVFIAQIRSAGRLFMLRNGKKGRFYSAKERNGVRTWRIQ